MLTSTHRTLASLVAALALAACSTQGASSGQSAAASRSDSARLARLEREARALAKTDGCATSAQCKAAPVGAKACGGPRYWLVYCATTTDSAALFRKLDELKAAEQAYNRSHGIVSDCSFATPPASELVGGVCRVQ